MQFLSDFETPVQMTKTTEMIGDISHVSTEQQTAMNELARSVERVASMTEQNVGVVRETSATVGNLNATVGRMRKAVTQYTV